MASVRPRPIWNSEITARLLEAREHPAKMPSSPHIEAMLEHVEVCMSSRPPLGSWQRLTEWWSGDRIEEVWSHLNQADIEMVAAAPPELFQEYLERAVRWAEALPVDDVARSRLEAYVGTLKAPALSQADVQIDAEIHDVIGSLNHVLGDLDRLASRPAASGGAD